MLFTFYAIYFNWINFLLQSFSRSIAHTVLHEIKLLVFNSRQCMRLMDIKLNHYSKVPLCTISPFNKGPCHVSLYLHSLHPKKVKITVIFYFFFFPGDEGGPFVYEESPEKFVLVGIHSFHSFHCGDRTPTFHTDVIAHRHWIEGNVPKLLESCVLSELDSVSSNQQGQVDMDIEDLDLLCQF